MECKVGDLSYNLREIENFVREGANMRIRLICFPELATTGYIPENLQDLAEPIPGPISSRIAKLAKEYKIHLVLGLPEKDGDKIYNSAVLISDQGHILYVYRKIHLWDKEKLVFARGNSIQVCQTDIGRISIGICYDIEHPEFSRTAALKGAEILCFPSAQMELFRNRINNYVMSRAAENCLFVLFSNWTGMAGGIKFFGDSQIVSPSGKVLTKIRAQKGIAVASINLSDIEKERTICPYFEDRRPEAYELFYPMDQQKI
jgi:predicted amidohydrolase